MHVCIYIRHYVCCTYVHMDFCYVGIVYMWVMVFSRSILSNVYVMQQQHTKKPTDFFFKGNRVHEASCIQAGVVVLVLI